MQSTRLYQGRQASRQCAKPAEKRIPAALKSSLLIKPIIHSCFQLTAIVRCRLFGLLTYGMVAIGIVRRSHLGNAPLIECMLYGELFCFLPSCACQPSLPCFDCSSGQSPGPCAPLPVRSVVIIAGQPKAFPVNVTEASRLSLCTLFNVFLFAASVDILQVP